MEQNVFCEADRKILRDLWNPKGHWPLPDTGDFTLRTSSPLDVNDFLMYVIWPYKLASQKKNLFPSKLADRKSYAMCINQQDAQISCD